MKKLILAIETSCDETGLALVEASGGLYAPKFSVLKNLISSQIKIHRPFGGVVPNLAKREHQKNLPLLWQRMVNNELKTWGKRKNTKFIIPAIDMIAVTVGPGLEPALWTGIGFAKDLYKKFKAENSKLKLIGANHMQGHLYSFLLSQKTANPKSEFLQLAARRKFIKMNFIRANQLMKRSFIISKQIQNPKSQIIKFPAIALIVSGGHTILLKMDSLTKWKKLGETRDDAAGEAFDKVARLLNLPYPGGPEIERLALSLPKGEKLSIAFPRPMLDQKNYDFSFSGLKTSVLYYLRDHPLALKNSKLKSDIAASFQQAVVDVLAQKTVRAAKEYGARSIILCGGVAANKSLKKRLKVECDMSHLTFYIPHIEYNTDNAAMIAAAGYFAYLKNKKLPLRANGDLGI